MAQGGKRPGAGRKKAERPTNANVAARVLAQAKAEQLWLSMIDLERRRLGLNKDGTLSEREKGAITDGEYRGNFSIIPLTNLLRYLEDRAYGRPVDTVNHLHDKPIEHNLNLNLSERFRIAMEKASKRVSDLR
jgi:hypothetical protein